METGMAEGAQDALQRKAASVRQLSKAIGWFSIGLGTAQLLMPGVLSRLIGIRDRPTTRNIMRAMGLRELGHGAAILRQPDSPMALWSRVAGDALDLALLSAAMTRKKNDGERIAGAMAAVLGVAALDVVDSIRAGRVPEEHQEPARSVGEIVGLKSPERNVHVSQTLTIKRPVEEVYEFWRDFKNLPRFMSHLESVEVLDGGRSYWKAKAPAGRSVEWNAELVADEPNERIEWRSLPGADISNSGVVSFRAAPGDRGTEVHVDLRYDPPAGKLGAAIAMIWGESPSQQVKDDLRAFKQVMETGEVVRSEGTLRGRYLQHPAQRPESEAAG